MTQLFIEVVNNEPQLYPLVEDNLRQIFTDLPEGYISNEDLKETPYVNYIPSPQPLNDNPLKEAIEVKPTEKTEDGSWIQKWELRDKIFSDEQEKQETIDLFIAREKLVIKAKINTERDRRESSTFPYKGKLLDANDKSVMRILASVQTAQACLAAGLPYQVDWVCADNKTITLDAQGMIDMPIAITKHGYELHKHSRVLKALAAEAITIQELESIDIYTGWPGEQIETPTNTNV